MQGTGELRTPKWGPSGLRWRPVINPLESITHKQGAVAVGQPVGDAKRLDPLLVGQQPDRSGPVSAPHAAIEAKGVEDAKERVPDVVVREGLVRQRAGATDFHRNGHYFRRAFRPLSFRQSLRIFLNCRKWGPECRRKTAE